MFLVRNFFKVCEGCYIMWVDVLILKEDGTGEWLKGKVEGNQVKTRKGVFPLHKIYHVKKFFMYKRIVLYNWDGVPIEVKDGGLSRRERLYKELLKYNIFKALGYVDKTQFYYGLAVGVVIGILILELLLPLLGIQITIGRV